MEKCNQEIVERKVLTLPTAKKYKKVQFSVSKKRTGKESVKFLGFNSGQRKVRFYREDGKEAILTVKTWLSRYGWAWRII